MKSMKSKSRDYADMNGSSSLPEKVFKGTFVVFTVVALLELPNGVSCTLITDVVELDFSHEKISISFREIQPSKRPTKPSNDKAVSSFAIQRRKFSPPSTWCHQSASATRKMTNRKIKDWRRANHNATSDLWHFSLTQNHSRKIHARKSSKPMSCGCRFAISQWRRAVDCRWVEIVQSIYCYKCQFMLMSCRCREDCSTEFMASRCDTHHLHIVRYISHVEVWVFTADMRGFS